MKAAFTTLLFALRAALLVYLTRKRLKFALTVGAIAYMVLLPIRLLFSADLAERMDDIVWPALIVFVIWLIASRLSIEYQKRRPPPTPRGRGGPFGRFRRS